MLVQEQLAATYTKQGYAVIPGVLSEAELAEFRKESDRLVALCSADPEAHPRRLQWEVDYLADQERQGMAGVIRKIEPLIDLSPAFARLAEHPTIAGAAEAALGEPVVLFEDKLNLKLPGGSGFPWHQDWSCCWRAHTDELVTCFIYLDDSSATNGYLQVVPGSQRDKHIYPFTEGSTDVDIESFDHDLITPVPLGAGGMIVFDPYLLHFSDRNLSGLPRRAIIYTYNPARLGEVNADRFPAGSSAAAGTDSSTS